MELFFYTGRLDLAATTLADLELLIAALADESDPTNAATIDNVTGKIPPLVQSDTGEPLTLKFYDDASTPASWAADDSVSLAIGLGYQDANQSYVFTSTATTAIVSTYRTATLALNTARLQSELSKWIGMSGSNSRYRPRFYLHLRKTTSGVSETVALLPVRVLPGVLSNPVVDDPVTQYITTAELEVAALALTNKDLSDESNTYRAATTSVDGAVTLDTPGGVPRLGDSLATVATQQIAWQNALTPIMLTDGTDSTFNLWPWNACFYDHIRDQVVVGYTSGSIRNESGSSAAYDKFPCVRIVANASAVRTYDTTRSSTRVVVSASGAAGSNISQPMNALGMVKTGPNAGRYVGIISRLAFANDPYPWSTNTQFDYAYSTDGGATWTVEALKDPSGTTITGSWATGIFASDDGSLYTWISSTMANDFSSYTQSLYRSGDGGNSWRLMGSKTVAGYIALASQLPSGTARPWEPFMVEYSPGRFLVMWRSSLGANGPVLAYGLVDNYGREISEWAATSLPALDQPASVVYDPETQMVELVFAARGDASTAGPGLYSASTPLSAAIRGVWNTAVKIRGALYSGTSNQDYAFYPQLVMVGARAWLFFYDRNTAGGSTTEVYCLHGISLLRRLRRNVPTGSQFTLWNDTLDQSKIIPGSILSWDMRNPELPGLTVTGARFRENTEAQALSIVYENSGSNPAIYVSPNRVNFPGVSQFEQLRHVPLITTWAPTTGVGLLCVVDLKAGMSYSAFRKIFTLNEETNNTQILSLQINTSGQLGALGRAGVGAASVTQNAPSWTPGVQVVGAWLDMVNNQITLYANGTSYGPLTVNTGSGFASNLRLIVGGVTTGGSSNIPANMDVYFAGAWQRFTGFEAARAELQTKFGVQ